MNNQRTEDFLAWLGGYFDHGGCCRTYKYVKTYRRHGKTYGPYPHLDVHIVITGTKETVEYIKNHYFQWNAKIKRRKTLDPEQSWIFYIRSLTEASFFCQELLPYSKFRQDDLQKIIETIKGWNK